jgi:hypothetical protein
MHFSFTTIPASLHIAKNDKALRDRLIAVTVKELQREAKIQIRMFQKTVRTWQSKPDFEYEIDVNDNVIQATVFTNDKIYYFLDRGTRRRFATMTKGFVSKTQPGVIGSRVGIGGRAYVNRRVPRPGIEPRRWTDTIFDRRRSIFIKRISQTGSKEVMRYWDKLFSGK